MKLNKLAKNSAPVGIMLLAAIMGLMCLASPSGRNKVISSVEACAPTPTPTPSPTPTPCVTPYLDHYPDPNEAMILLNENDVTNQTVRLRYIDSNNSWPKYGFNGFLEDNDTVYCPINCSQHDDGTEIIDVEWISQFDPPTPPSTEPGGSAAVIELTDINTNRTDTSLPEELDCYPDDLSTGNDLDQEPSCTVKIYGKHTPPGPGDPSCFATHDPSAMAVIYWKGCRIVDGTTLYVGYDSGKSTPAEYGFTAHVFDSDMIHAWDGSSWQDQYVEVAGWTGPYPNFTQDWSNPGTYELRIYFVDEADGAITPSPICMPDSMVPAQDANAYATINVVLDDPLSSDFQTNGASNPGRCPFLVDPIDVGSGAYFDNITDFAIPVKHGLSLRVGRTYSSQGFSNDQNTAGNVMLGFSTTGNWHMDTYESRIQQLIWNERGTKPSGGIRYEDHVLGYVTEQGDNIYFDLETNSTVKIADATQIKRLFPPTETSLPGSVWVSRFTPVKAGFAPNNAPEAEIPARQTTEDIEIYILHTYSTANTIPAGQSPATTYDPNLTTMGIDYYVARHMDGRQFIYDASGKLLFLDANWRNNVPQGDSGHVDDYLTLSWGSSGGYGATDRIYAVSEGTIASPSSTTGRRLLFHYNINNVVDYVDFQAGNSTVNNIVNYDYDGNGKLYRVIPNDDTNYGAQYNYGVIAVTGDNTLSSITAPPSGFFPGICLVSRYRADDGDLIRRTVNEYDYTQNPVRVKAQWVYDPLASLWRKSLEFTANNTDSGLTVSVTHESGQTRSTDNNRYDGRSNSANDKPVRTYHFNEDGDVVTTTFSASSAPMPQTRQIYISGTRLIDKEEMLVSSGPDEWVTTVDYTYDNNLADVPRLTSVTRYAGYNTGTYASEDPMTTTITWDGTLKDFPATITYPDYRKEVYSYDASGYLTQLLRQRKQYSTGNYVTFETVTYARDTSAANYGHLLSVSSDPAGSAAPTKTATLSYFSSTNYGSSQIKGMPSQIVVDNKTTAFTYDLFGNVESAIDDDGTTTYLYSGSGQSDTTVPPRLIKITDIAGNDTLLHYDDFGRLEYLDEADGDSLERRTTYEYDLWDNVKKVEAPEDSGTADHAREYDIYGNLLKSTDPVGNINLYTYDEFDRLVEENLFGTSTAGSPERTLTYDYTTGAVGSCGSCSGAGQNLISRKTITDGTYTDELYFKYDLAGRLVQRGTDSNADDVTYTYDGTLLFQVEEDGELLFGDGNLTYEYDDYYRLFREIYPNQRFVEYSYDDAGRLAAYKDPFGFINEIVYDADGRLDSLTHSSLGTASFSYNNTTDDLLQTLTLGNTAYTSFGYDGYNRLISYDLQEKPGGSAARLLKHEWIFDALWRKDASNPSGDISVTSSYTNGNNKIDITYDTASRLTREKLTDGTTSEWDNQYGYDKNENRTALDDGSTAYTFTYGAQNEETAVTAVPTPAPDDMDQDYRGNVVSREPLAGGNPFEYTWDAWGRLKLVERVGSGDVTYGYDPMGRMITRTEDSGATKVFYWLGMNLLGQEQWGTEPGASGLSFRPDSEQSSTATTNGWYVWGGAGTQTMTYVADAERGNVLRLHSTAGGTAPGSFLIGEETAADTNPNDLAFDITDRWHLGMWIKNESDQPMFIRVYMRYYDGLAEEEWDWRLSIITADFPDDLNNYYIGSTYNDGEWHYIEFDLEERLKSTDASDYLIKLYGIQVNCKEAYVDDIIFSGGQLEKSLQIIPGLPVGGLLGAQTGVNGATGVGAWGKYYYQTNDLGTVIATTDADAEKIGVYSPDFFGNYRYVDGTRPDLFGISGKYFDAASGLHYYGARWYEPERARWMSEEPLGLDGPNLYQFVFNNGSNSVDWNGYARIITSISEGITIWDPEDGTAPIEYPSLVAVVPGAKTGAAGTFCSGDTYVTRDHSYHTAKERLAYGPGPMIRFRDPCPGSDIRARWIHGGGTRLKDRSGDPYQPLGPTKGCTRMHNAQVADLADRIDAYRRNHPNEAIPYERVDRYYVNYTNAWVTDFTID